VSPARAPFAVSSPGAVALAGALAVALVAPWLIDNQFALLLISLSGIAYLVALGLKLVMGFAGQVSLGHAALVGVGAYASAVLTTRYELPFVVGFAAAGALGGGVGLLLGIPALRLAGPYLAMATMAFNIVVQRLLLNWSELTGGPDGLSGIPPPGLGPVVLDRRTAVYLVAGVALAGLWLSRNLVH
jgi:ABC-type branched-subunit amino acid transport system permease subunit